MERVVEAKYELKEVFRLIGESKYWFSAPSRSVNEVIKVYSGSGSPKSNSEAEKFITDGVLTLTDGNFYQSATQWGMVVDIYGLIYDGKPWYVKFAIADEEEGGVTEPLLQEISFHPPEKEFVTSGGIKISSGGTQCV
jgi:hypothetical protein